MQESEQLYGDEIDLREFVKSFFRWKWFLTAFVAVVVFAAAIISYLVLPPRYEITGVFYIPKVGDGLDLPPAMYEIFALSGRVLGRVEREYPQGSISRRKLAERFTMDVNTGTRTLKVTAAANTPELAKWLVDSWHEAFGMELHRYVENRLQQELSMAIREAETLSARINELRGAAPDAQQADSVVPGFLEWSLMNSYGRQYVSASLHVERLREIGGQLDRRAAVQVLTAPELPEQTNPVSPRPALNMAVAAILGAFSGAGYVLIREWWSGDQQDDQQLERASGA